MQITFLIGNGFDLNLGLRTRYEHFYPVYCRLPLPSAHSLEVSQFKKLLIKEEGDFSRWADFEKALGDYTAVPPLNQQAPLRACLQDFKRQFALYLQNEENRIDFDACDVPMAGKFLSDLVSHLDYVERHTRNIIQGYIPARYAKTYCILDFNYTTVLDRLLSCLEPDDIQPHSLEPLLHVHGTHSSGMILGVDNIGQVANPDLFEFPRQQRLILKPLLNQQSGPDNDRIASRYIETSDEICVFGMSLGETDAIWWRRIGQWLSGSSRHQLLIFIRGRQMDPLFFEDILDYKNDLQETFFTRADIPQEQWEPLRDQVHIALNAGIFDLQPAWFSSASGNSSGPV